MEKEQWKSAHCIKLCVLGIILKRGNWWLMRIQCGVVLQNSTRSPCHVCGKTFVLDFLWSFWRPRANYETKDWQGEMNEDGEERLQDEWRLINEHWLDVQRRDRWRHLNFRTNWPADKLWHGFGVKVWGKNFVETVSCECGKQQR